MIKLQENSTQQNLSHIPGSPHEPEWLQTMWGILRPIDYLETMHQRYGDTFIIPKFAGLPPQLITSNPQAIQQIFTTDPKQFVCGSGNEMIQPLVGDNSLILLDGDHHLTQRKLLMPPFHGERMQAYGKLTLFCHSRQRKNRNPNNPTG